MKKFLLTYWLGIALLFAIFYWELSPLNPMFNHMQTDFTALLTSFTLPNEMMYKPSNFSLAHDFLGNTLLILISVLLFIFFIKTRERTT